MPIGVSTKAGIQISDEQLLQISAVLQGVRFISQTIAGLPRFIFRHLEDGRSREKDTGHDLNRILRYQPNPWQTSFQFVEMMTAHAMLKGFGWAERIYEAGKLVALAPLEPNSLIKWEQLTSGKIRYTYRKNDGSSRTLLQDELFVLPGFSIDGVLGLPLVSQMRETAGLEKAIENYGASFFANSAMPRVVLTTPKAISSKEVRERMRVDWNRTYSGDDQHSTALLEEDTKVNVLSTKNDEAQFNETRKFLITEFSRFLDVTPHRLSDMEKSSYNNMEQMSLETVVYTLTPWVRRWEQCSYRDLLTGDDKAAGRYIEFVLEGLLRGDTAARSQFYKDGIYAGWLTRNEVREKENHNPLEGLDDPLQPQNYLPVDSETGVPQAPAQAVAAQPGGEPRPETERAEAIARAAAERVVRKEIQAINRWKERENGSRTPPDWRKQIEGFYSEHASLVAKAMAISEETAKNYCDVQCAIALKFGAGAIKRIEAWCAEQGVALLVAEALKR
jgi:HK97 family phage portal protein